MPKDIFGVKVDRNDPESIVVYSPNNPQQKSAPLKVGNVENFTIQLYNSAISKKWIDPTKIPQAKFTEEFEKFWNGKETAPPTLNLDSLDFEPPAPAQVPTLAPPTTNPQPTAPPLTPVIPKPTTSLADFQPKAQAAAPIVSAPSDKPKEITVDWLKSRYTQLFSSLGTREKVITQLAAETNMLPSMLEAIIPIEQSVLPKPAVPQMAPMAPAFQPPTQQPAPLPMPAPQFQGPQIPAPNPQTQFQGIPPLQVQTQQVTQISPTVPEADLSALTKGITPTQLNWLREISKKKKVDERVLIAEYARGAKERQLPTHWTNLMFEDAMALDIVKGKKDKYIYLLLWTQQGFVEAFARPNLKVELEKCYQVPELGKIGRLVATSRPIGLDNFPDQNKPMISQITETGELQIPPPYSAYQPQPLAQVLAQLKFSGKGIIETVSGNILDIVPWESNEGCFFSINDGSDVPMYSSKVMLNWDSPAIDRRVGALNEEQMVAKKGKYAMIYGIIEYSPGNPEKKFPEGLRISPLYLIISG